MLFERCSAMSTVLIIVSVSKAVHLVSELIWMGRRVSMHGADSGIGTSGKVSRKGTGRSTIEEHWRCGHSCCGLLHVEESGDWEDLFHR